MGTNKPIDLSAAFPFQVPERNLPLVVQELEMGGTRNQRGNRHETHLADVAQVARQSKWGMVKEGLGPTLPKSPQN
jgi:hypothetical protein